MKRILYFSILFLFPIILFAQSNKITIHFILFTPPEENDIGSKIVNNYFKKTFVPNLEEYLKAECEIKKYYDNSYNEKTLDNLKNIIENIASKPNDVIFFYRVGHGHNKGKNEYPFISFGDEKIGIEILDVYNTLRKKPHRLLVVMTETCNRPLLRNDKQGVSLSGTSPNKGNIKKKEQFKELFINSKGDYLMSSSSKGEFSIDDFFISAFQKVFDETVDESNKYRATWEIFLNRTKLQTSKNVPYAYIRDNKWCQNPQWFKGNYPYDVYESSNKAMELIRKSRNGNDIDARELNEYVKVMSDFYNQTYDCRIGKSLNIIIEYVLKKKRLKFENKWEIYETKKMNDDIMSKCGCYIKHH